MVHRKRQLLVNPAVYQLKYVRGIRSPDVVQMQSDIIKSTVKEHRTRDRCSPFSFTKLVASICLSKEQYEEIIPAGRKTLRTARLNDVTVPACLVRSPSTLT